MSITGRYPASTRARYIQATQSLKAHFWDWAADPTVPSSTALRTVPINTPRGRASLNSLLVGYTYPREALSNAFGLHLPKGESGAALLTGATAKVYRRRREFKVPM
ncbi:hypothetical protein HIM_08238 [Hirsutella minnesotensis 3608]|uniref:Uncharacterized protein n=1 Tax=Hirsutella minnesotensis 3608 TaxID=1043627 RepID=A0A0F7ZXW6_9HYPO|nr:hypothetical protein HIM_09161 [Hirsutella minnesotensis 3608]KJZ72312.1 hypothetical protein HIM_08238 [Hirsutella minnesotensis 3608]